MRAVGSSPVRLARRRSPGRGIRRRRPRRRTGRSGAARTGRASRATRACRSSGARPRTSLWKSAIPGRGHSSPVVWGDRIFLTTAVEGDVVPGAKPVKHMIEGQEFQHPDGVGADRKQTLKVLALDAKDGQHPLGEDRLGGNALRHAPQARQLRFADAGRRTASASTRTSAPRASTPTTSTASSSGAGRRGGIATFGVGVGTSPVLYEKLVIVQCDEDNGEKSFIVGARQDIGQGGLARRRATCELSWATPILVKSGGRARAGHRRQPGGDRLRPGDRAASCGACKGLESNAVPSPVAGDGVVVRLGGLPGQARGGDPARRVGRRHRGRPRAVALRQGHGLRALADPRAAGSSTSSPTRGSSPASTRRPARSTTRAAGRRWARASWPRRSRSRATCCCRAWTATRSC